jgi:hypothetical protein
VVWYSQLWIETIRVNFYGHLKVLCPRNHGASVANLGIGYFFHTLIKGIWLLYTLHERGLKQEADAVGAEVPAHPCHITVEVYPRLPQAGVTAAPALGQSKFSQKNKMNLTGKFILMELFKLKKNF